ncbi:hypothetical protein OKA04_04075 [Luteolibacter flavescens]|uniref:Lipoprotein n=1 Tax=Luteolibacter flavescens TaxID=1859460 RepID=A0ABT3FK20_9BACT|nr:hypothetical protein [Luteolibacter flavescens]MCW1883891.1 hypothetical protein [Luteolibacter flavescens]
MKLITRLLAVSSPLLLLIGCAGRTEFTPEGGPVTVGMPAQLSERERTHVMELDNALRSEGYQPVRHGAGELKLDFRIAEGPINTDTTIRLSEGRTVLAEGYGRGSGMPMIGRDKIADRSFQKAFGDFHSALPGAAAARTHGTEIRGSGDEMEYVY